MNYKFGSLSQPSFPWLLYLSCLKGFRAWSNRANLLRVQFCFYVNVGQLLSMTSGGRQWYRKHTACMISHLGHVQLFAIQWTVAHQDPLSMEFSRQEYWSGLPGPPPGDLPDPEIESTSPAVASRFFTTEYHLGSPRKHTG